VQLEQVDPLRDRLRDELKLLLTRCERLLHHVLITDPQKETWLIYYYYGKIAEKRGESTQAVRVVFMWLKRQQRCFAQILAHYLRAAFELQTDGAKYPDRVRYGRQDKSFEALELHYRPHALILKRLVNGTSDARELDMMLSYLRVFREHGVVRNEYVKDRDKVGWLVYADSGEAHSIRFNTSYDVSSTMHMLSAQVVTCVGQSYTSPIADDIEILDSSSDASTRQCVLTYCLDAMRLCIKRYVNFYKPYYRLAWAYVHVVDIQVV
jgi:hypothetical protein